MTTGLIIAVAMATATSFSSPEVAHFPGQFFDALAKPNLQRRAMETWPGPSQVMDLWRAGEIEPGDRIAVLLGCSASHDPVLLPIYLEAVTSPDERLRMAAVYGYRELLGDGRPNVTNGVDVETGRQIAKEITLVTQTLRARPLTEFWLQAALSAEGGDMPGWTGVTLRRSTSVCFGALEKIIDLEDIGLLTVAWRSAEKMPTKIALMKLIEATTLQTFMVKPRGERTGWGTRDVEDAFEATDAFVELWLDRRCTTDPNRVLLDSLRRLGVRGIRPMDPAAWDVWIAILDRGDPSWRVIASRRLYALGGRWAGLSIFRSESPAQAKLLDGLRRDYGLIPAHLMK